MTTTDGMLEGMVIRAVGGIFWVVTEDRREFSCRLRGRVRRSKGREGERILPGDSVRFHPLDEDEGIIEEVLPRRVALKRPVIANVTQVVIVISLDNPPPNLDLLDRLLVLADREVGRSVIVFNKMDKVSEEARTSIAEPYLVAGYPVAFTSCVTGDGLSDVAEHLRGQLTILAGESGAGKSSLLNALLPGLNRETQSVSDKTRRGRHTTRAVELIELPRGGWIADSPGFSTLELFEIPKEELSHYYPEFAPLRNECRFAADCLHWREPGCAVKWHLDQGRLDAGRYRRYLNLLRELADYELRRY